MDEEARWHRHHAAITRAHELLSSVDETLDECAIREATRPHDQPDALEQWAAGMPKPAAQEGRRVTREGQRTTAAEIDAMRQVMLLKRQVAKLERASREAARYRNNLELAIGKVIGGERKEVAALRAALDGLRADVDALRPSAATPPVPRLVQAKRTIGHAVSA